MLRCEQRHVARELHHIVARVLASHAAFGEQKHSLYIIRQMHCVAACAPPLHKAFSSGGRLRVGSPRVCDQHPSV